MMLWPCVSERFRDALRRPIVVLVLAALCLISGPAPRVQAEPAAIRVAVYDDAGITRSIENVVKAVAASRAYSLKRIKAGEIRAGMLAGFDVLIVPGGSAYEQATTLGLKGREEIKSFVRAGGGYVGICAGAYLALCGRSWSCWLIDARNEDGEHWARGVADLEIELSPSGMAVFGMSRPRLLMHFRQGPLMVPAHERDLPDFLELARFVTEVAENGAPKGVMIGTAAIAAGHYGRGRVLCFSPHPELTPGLDGMLRQGIAWAAEGGKPSL